MTVSVRVLAAPLVPRRSGPTGRYSLHNPLSSVVMRCGMLTRMPEQIAVRLDTELAQRARAEAEAADTTLSDWVRAAIRYQVALAAALRARSQEDAREPLYTPEQEDALLAARARRARAVFADLDA